MTHWMRAARLGMIAILLLHPHRAIAREKAIAPTSGQRTPEAQRLYDEIARMDAAMFDAFNAQDIDTLMALFSSDLEFYHDKGGLQSYSEVTAGFQRLFAQKNGLRRDLVKGSLEVYPIKGYGAIEVGEHRFCHSEAGQPDCGTFKFLHVWKENGGKWQVTRVVSYGH